LNPNSLLVHRNWYSEGIEDGQKTPRGHPNFNSYVENLCVLVFQTDGLTDADNNPVWASHTMFLQVKFYKYTDAKLLLVLPPEIAEI
jgi:hypothetical protein